MKKLGCLLALLLVGCPNPPSRYNDLRGVWGSDVNHVWAIG